MGQNRWVSSRGRAARSRWGGGRRPGRSASASLSIYKGRARAREISSMIHGGPGVAKVLTVPANAATDLVAADRAPQSRLSTCNGTGLRTRADGPRRNRPACQPRASGRGSRGASGRPIAGSRTLPSSSRSWDGTLTTRSTEPCSCTTSTSAIYRWRTWHHT